jgi:type II secretory pathway pseudopilin PulG
MLSKNGVAIVGTLLALVLPSLGIIVPETEIQAFLLNAVAIVNFIILCWNQWKRPDTTGFLWKTPKTEQ